MQIGEIMSDLLSILSIQTVLIAMELGSKNSIAIAMKDDEIKQNIRDRLKSYLTHAVFAMFILSVYMYICHGVVIMIISIILNGLIISWIYNQYDEFI